MNFVFFFKCISIHPNPLDAHQPPKPEKTHQIHQSHITHSRPTTCPNPSDQLYPHNPQQLITYCVHFLRHNPRPGRPPISLCRSCVYYSRPTKPTHDSPNSAITRCRYVFKCGPGWLYKHKSFHSMSKSNTRTWR